jgi:prepilin-type N-terminal cleavage/methylation domain-containing protein
MNNSAFKKLEKCEIGSIQNRVRTCAFSLIELLVALTVLCLLCALLFSIVSNATKLWRDQEGREESFREARAALNFISRDIGNALDTKNQGWFYSSSNQMAFLASLPAGAQSEGRNQSDICAIGYSLEWGKANPNDPSEKECMALYRYVRFSNPTYADNVLPAAGVKTVFDNPDGQDTVRELLARNVSRMSFVPYSTNDSGVPVPYAPTTSSSMPDFVGLSISTINERTAAQLGTNQTEWRNTNSLLLKQNEQSFSLVVHTRK